MKLLKEQLQELEQQYPNGLNGDVHYLAGLINYSDTFRKQEIACAIRWWTANLRHGCRNQQEVQTILGELKTMVEYKE